MPESPLNVKIHILESPFRDIYEYEDLDNMIIEGVPASDLDLRVILAMLYMCNQADKNNMLISVLENDDE